MATQTLTGLRDLGIQWGSPDERALEALYNSRMATKLLDGLERDTRDRLRENLRGALMNGVDLGQHPLDTARQMQDQLGQTLGSTQSRMNNIARTEQLDAYRASGRDAGLANSDVCTGWTWMSVVSQTTCPSCIAMHGTQHPLDELGPDDHPQGRCYRMPTTKSWADLGFDNIPEPPSLVPDAGKWFESQTASVQRSILGRDSWAAWRKGDFPMSAWAKEVRNSQWRRSFMPSNPAEYKVIKQQAVAKQHGAALQNAKDMKIKWRIADDGVVVLEEPLTAMRAAHWKKIGLEYRVEKAVADPIQVATERVRELKARVERLRQKMLGPTGSDEYRRLGVELAKARKELSAAMDDLAMKHNTAKLPRNFAREIADLEKLSKEALNRAALADRADVMKHMTEYRRLEDQLLLLRDEAAKAGKIGYETLEDAAKKAGKKRADRDLPNTFKEVNPGKIGASDKTMFERYSNNCTHCVDTWTAREMGYNVKALPIPERLVTNAGKASVEARGRNINEYFQGKWLNPDGSPVTIYGGRVKSFTQWDWKRALPAAEKKAQEQAVTAAAAAWGDGYGIVECVWTGGSSGHVFIVKVERGVVSYLEPQTSMGYGGDAISHFGRMTGGTRLIRMDGLIPRDTLLGDIFEWA